jgi:N-acetylglucosaminyldiphosphoundecaprenol N-acetyl-beta-D-mannosaminyltransferase
MSERANILNCPVDKLSMDETISLIDKSINENKPMRHVVVNAAKLVFMKTNDELYNAVVTCDIINADGQAVVWASKFLGDPLPERTSGIDIMEELIKRSESKGYKIFFLGAKEEVVSKVVEIYSEKYSPNIIAGYRNGYFKEEESEQIANQIAESGAHILLVAISSPMKELFLEKYRHVIKTPFIMGVGGSFDVVAGKVKRAPVWMQKSGLEWFYRLVQEPKRMWKRYLYTNSLFIYYLIIAVIKKQFSKLKIRLS